MKRQILFKNKHGEYMPCNKEDTLLTEWCIEYNESLKKGKGEYTRKPIYTNLIFYVTSYPQDIKLVEWCKIHNDELKRQRREAYESERNGSD